MHNCCAMKNIRYMSYLSTWLKKIKTNAAKKMMTFTAKANLQRYNQPWMLLTNYISKNIYDQCLKKVAVKNRLA